jgi:hypothetical protein
MNSPVVPKLDEGLIEALCQGLEAQEAALRKRDFAGLESAVNDLQKIVLQLQTLEKGPETQDTTGFGPIVGQKSVERLRKAASSRQVVSELIQLQLGQIEAMLNPVFASDNLEQTYTSKRSANGRPNKPVKLTVSRRV